MKEREISDNEIQVLGASRTLPLREERILYSMSVSPPSESQRTFFAEESEDPLTAPSQTKSQAATRLSNKRLLHRSVSNRRIRLSAILIIAMACCIVAVMAFFIWYILSDRANSRYETVSLERENVLSDTREEQRAKASSAEKYLSEFQPQGYVEAFSDTVNDVPLIVYVPKYAVPELLVGVPDESDPTIVFVAQAADLGGNNYGIVGDFVYRGAPMGHGGRKEGYCAIIGSKLTIGISYETPLYKQSIDEKGYFFRQYPLVKNGEPIENKPRGKAIRRALAIKEGTVMMFESSQRESFHDFACALSDYGVSEAIYLVGSTAYGWYRDSEGQVTTFGAKDDREWQDINYLVWRRRR